LRAFRDLPSADDPEAPSHLHRRTVPSTSSGPSLTPPRRLPTATRASRAPKRDQSQAKRGCVLLPGVLTTGYLGMECAGSVALAGPHLELHLSEVLACRATVWNGLLKQQSRVFPRLGIPQADIEGCAAGWADHVDRDSGDRHLRGTDRSAVAATPRVCVPRAGLHAVPLRLRPGTRPRLSCSARRAGSGSLGAGKEEGPPR
jgi:hypothetical protein